MLTLFELGVLAHLTGDWILQNDWMARNKHSLRHPAAWVHSGIQAALLALALGWQAGLVLGAIHLIVDTRRPMRWWQHVFRQTTTGEAAISGTLKRKRSFAFASVKAVICCGAGFSKCFNAASMASCAFSVRAVPWALPSRPLTK